MKNDNSYSLVKWCVALGLLTLLVHLSFRDSVGQDVADQAKVAKGIPDEVVFKERILDWYATRSASVINCDP